MAEIVLGMWNSRGPTLSTTAEQWLLRVPSDTEKPDHPFRGSNYSFDALVRLRADEDLVMQSSLAERERRAAACTEAIARMADAFEAARIPAGIHEAESGHSPSAYTEYPGHPQLAHRIIEEAVRSGFDIATSQRLPTHAGHWSSGIGHAFGFVYRQIMRDRVVPNVPIIFNTFFPPNQPPARRCFEFGRSVARAIRAWPQPARVAIFGSGGMSHFVIDEALDRLIFSALQNRDAEALCSIDESYLQSGSSELKNWIAAAGVLFETSLQGGVVGYQPCYRSEAGTGTANGFVCWRQ